MTTTQQPADISRITGADELIQAIPYLLGFHPAESLVLVCLDAAGHIVLTARLDLDDVRAALALVAQTVGKAANAGAERYLCVLYTDAPDSREIDRQVSSDERVVASAARLPGFDIARLTDHATALHGGELLSAFLVRHQRSWSYTCQRPCCPAEGSELPSAPSAFVTRATVEGVVALPDRATQAASLDPYPEHRRAALDGALADAERTGVSATVSGARARHDRSVRRALFAAARASHEPGWVPPGPDEIARSCPPPYDAAALFLYGWACWRAGNGMLAALAADRALQSSPGYTAAQLLDSAVTNGLDPHSVPRLRRPRGGRAR